MAYPVKSHERQPHAHERATEMLTDESASTHDEDTSFVQRSTHRSIPFHVECCPPAPAPAGRCRLRGLFTGHDPAWYGERSCRPVQPQQGLMPLLLLQRPQVVWPGDRSTLPAKSSSTGTGTPLSTAGEVDSRLKFRDSGLLLSGSMKPGVAVMRLCSRQGLGLSSG